MIPLVRGGGRKTGKSWAEPIEIEMVSSQTERVRNKPLDSFPFLKEEDGRNNNKKEPGENATNQ